MGIASTEALEGAVVPSCLVEEVPSGRNGGDFRVAWASASATSRFGRDLVGALVERDEPFGPVAGLASELLIAGARQRTAVVERVVRRLGRQEHLRFTIVPAAGGAILHVEEVSSERQDTPGKPVTPGPSLAQVEQWGNLGVWEVDLRSQEVYWSSQVFEILGVDEPGLDSFLACVHPDDRALLDHLTPRLLEQPGPYRVTHRIVRGDEVRTVDQHMQSIPDAGGEPVRLIGTMIDTTEAEMLQQRMLQAETARVIGLMAAGLVHDFKNALTIIAGHAHLLLGDPRLDVGMQSSIEAIGRAAESAGAISRRLMTLGRHDGHVQPTNVRSLLEGVVALVGPAVEPAVQVRVEIGAERGLDALPVWSAPLVLVDPAHLNQVLVDLVLNARDAEASTVTIWFRTEHVDPSDPTSPEDLVAGQYGLLSVVDDGRGMDPDTVAKAFEPFFSTKGDGGSGLGLANVRAFAERCGGAVTIESTVGVGTSLHVFLPLDRHEATPATDRRRRRTRVLVIARPTETADRLGASVRALGHQTVLATEESSARYTLETEPIDAVVVDEGWLASSSMLVPEDLPVVVVAAAAPAGGERSSAVARNRRVGAPDAVGELLDELLAAPHPVSR